MGRCLWNGKGKKTCTTKLAGNQRCKWKPIDSAAPDVECNSGRCVVASRKKKNGKVKITRRCKGNVPSDTTPDSNIGVDENKDKKDEASWEDDEKNDEVKMMVK